MTTRRAFLTGLVAATALATCARCNRRSTRMTTLYNCCTSVDRLGQVQYRITKFVDGEVESSYLCNMAECECPAGHRASCRHRQMLPMMIAERIVNTHFFWDFDHHTVVTFEGIDAGPLQAAAEGPLAEPAIATFIELPADADVATEFAKLLHPTTTPPTPPTPVRRRL